MKTHIKTGDTVVVISGSQKGKSGKVLQIVKGKNRAIVEGLNMVKRHQKAASQEDPGGIIEREASLHISNLMEESRYNSRHSK
ncbi:MAG: 50S ribosomal protein L24 [Opitutales bacterium]|jgi:large subunit ribosomal protein L24|nr:50S ribosomal protein L24 [Opitutales bacterium]